jgi:hypothetical protein
LEGRSPGPDPNRQAFHLQVLPYGCIGQGIGGRMSKFLLWIS